MKKPFISVVITAYNRKEFLLDALKSAVNQTLKRDKYEIICIKNFKNVKIDKYLKYNNIINIAGKEKPIGEWLYLTTKKARGEIIVFLDDDDLFSKDKLETIYFYFAKYAIGFYHNSSLKGKKLENKLSILSKNNFKIIKYPYRCSLRYFEIATFNMSSIAVKKEILLKHINELKKVITSPDSFILLISLIQKTNVFIDYNKYTFYRLHNNNVSYSKSLEKYVKFNKRMELPALIYQLELANIYRSKAGKTFLGYFIFMIKSALTIQGKNKKEVISTFRYLPLIVNGKLIKRVILLILFLFRSEYPYKRLTRNFKQA